MKIGMREHEILDLIRGATKRSGRRMAIVGIGMLLMGGFMVSLHAFEIDSEAADMSTGALAALYGFAALFALFGAGMVWMGLFKFEARGRAIVAALAGDSRALEKVEHVVIQTKGAPGKLGQVHQLAFTVGGTATQLTVKEADVAPILGFVAERAPHALPG